MPTEDLKQDVGITAKGHTDTGQVIHNTDESASTPNTIRTLYGKFVPPLHEDGSYG